MQKTKTAESLMAVTHTHTHTHTHTSNLIEGKSQAFLCFICDIYERQIRFYLSFWCLGGLNKNEKRKWNNINCINDNYNCDFNIGTE